jgi:hypothetical protein
MNPNVKNLIPDCCCIVRSCELSPRPISMYGEKSLLPPPPVPVPVVTLNAVLCGPVPTPLVAATLKVNVVWGVKPVAKKLVPALVPTEVPFLNTV